LIITLGLFGFALFFHIVFGPYVKKMSSLTITCLTLFEWMCGKFEIDELLDKSEFIAMVFFVMFMVIFYFICTNMFLATMLNRYSETVGKMDVDRCHQDMNRSRSVRLVEYANIFALQDDLEVVEVVQGQGVVVKKIKDGGTAYNMGVEPGNIIFRVNKNKNFGRVPTGDGTTYRHLEERDKVMPLLERLVDDRTGIEVGFKDGTVKTGFFGGLASDQEKTIVRPTVKSFWRSQGAVSCIWRDVEADDRKDADAAEARHNTEEEAGDGEDGDGAQLPEGDDGADGEDVHDSGGKHNAKEEAKRRKRTKTKKVLDSILFSRWIDGTKSGKDGSTGTDRGWANFGGVEVVEKEAKHDESKKAQSGDAANGDDDETIMGKDVKYDEENWDTGELEDALNKIRVTGQEAWLDCLVSAVEREMAEMDDESIITEVLRTGEMADMGSKKGHGHAMGGQAEKLYEQFYRRADRVAKMLEFKANKMYYQYVERESDARQKRLSKQNEVLHDYVCELEKEFEKIMGEIHSLEGKKEVMLDKLQGLLEPQGNKAKSQTRSSPAQPKQGWSMWGSSR